MTSEKSKEERYKMALEAISTMCIPSFPEGRRDYIMQRIAEVALKDVREG